MSDSYVCIDGSDVYYLVDQFETASEAVDFAEENNVPGIVTLRSEYELSADYIGKRLDGIKNTLKAGLADEAVRRIKLIDPFYTYDTALSLHLQGSDQGGAPVAAAMLAAGKDIDALSNLPDAESYDVTADPGWP